MNSPSASPVELQTLGDSNANGFQIWKIKASDYIKVYRKGKYEYAQVLKVNKKSINVRIDGFSTNLTYNAGWIDKKGTVTAGTGQYVKWADYEKVKAFNDTNPGVDYFDL